MATALLGSPRAHGQTARLSDARFVDRVVARWHAPETGGVARPRFVFARELAFEARLEALADGDADTAKYRERHVRAALDRHIAESLLASLPISPAPRPDELAARAEAARAAVENRVRGRARLLAAASAEGIGSDELDAILRRSARASLYLDRMVAPMVEPSESELAEIHRGGTTPYSGQSFEDALPGMRRWFTAKKVAQAIDAYYQNVRSRVVVVVIR